MDPINKTVFNPDTILDKATFANPYQTAEGISYVIVNATPIVREGKLVENTYPGQEMLNHLADQKTSHLGRTV